MNEKTDRRGWVVLWAAIGINFFCGLGYVWSIIGKALRESLGWTGMESTLPYTVFSVSFAAAMALAGPIQDRRGPRFVASLGGVMIGGGLVLSGFALRPLPMVLSFGVLTGFGIGSMYSATVPPAVKWFPPSQKGRINGVVVAMVALASLLYSPLTRGLIAGAGIAPTFWALGLGTLIVLTGLAQLLKNPPVGYVAAGPATAASMAAAAEVQAARAADLGPRAMLRSSDFYKLWFMFAFASASGLMITGQAATIAKVQARWEGGFILVIIISLFNAVGRIAGGALSDRIGRPALMRLMFLVQAVNMLLFPFYTEYPVLMIGVAVAGACYGASMVVFSASTADLYGMRNFGANYGLVYLAWGSGGIIALAAAAIFDATGSFDLASIAAACLAILGLIIALTFKPRVGSRV